MRTFARRSCLSRPRFRSKVQQGKRIGGPKRPYTPKQGYSLTFVKNTKAKNTWKHHLSLTYYIYLYIICSDASSADCASDVRRAWYWPGCWPDRTKIDLIHLGPWVGSTNHLNNPLSISTSWTWTHGHQSISSFKHGMISISSSNSESTTCAMFFSQFFSSFFHHPSSIRSTAPVRRPHGVNLHVETGQLLFRLSAVDPIDTFTWKPHLQHWDITYSMDIEWSRARVVQIELFPKKSSVLLICLNQLLLCRANGLTSMNISGPMPLSWS